MADCARATCVDGITVTDRDGRRAPVFVVPGNHDASDAKHLENPNAAHDMNVRDRFENLLADRLADGTTIDAATTIEQATDESRLSFHVATVDVATRQITVRECLWPPPDHLIWGESATKALPVATFTRP